MIKLINLLRENLNEAKQVGDIYHFTSYENTISIINDDFNLKSFGNNSDNSYISFTRNRNMTSPTVYRDVRITIDGDNLSNKYKIEPFADTANCCSSITLITGHLKAKYQNEQRKIEKYFRTYISILFSEKKRKYFLYPFVK